MDSGACEQGIEATCYLLLVTCSVLLIEATPVSGLEGEGHRLQNTQRADQRTSKASGSSEAHFKWRAAWVTLALGQRMGDVLKVTAPSVTRINDTAAITVVEGRRCPQKRRLHCVWRRAVR